MKKDLSVLLLLACLLGSPAVRAEAAPAVYRVRNQEGAKIYLLGTLHVGKESMAAWSGEMEEAWRESCLLAVETDALALRENAQAAARYSAALLYGPGDEAKNHLSADTYALGLRLLNRTKAQLDRMRPMAWLSLAEENACARLGYSGEYGIDLSLLRRAREEGKPVEELEGLDCQAALMQALPDRACDLLIARMLEDPKTAEEKLDRLFGAWLRGDEAELTALIRTDIRQDAEEDGALERYNALLYEERNRRFAWQAEAYLSRGKTVLMAVGAAHVLGENGIRDRLLRGGYTVEKVEP